MQTPCRCFRSLLKLQLTLIGFASLSECVCIQSLLYNLVLEHENVIWCFVQVCQIFSDQLLEIINLLVKLDVFIHLPCLNTAPYGTLEQQKYGIHMKVAVGKAIILIQTQHYRFCQGIFSLSVLFVCLLLQNKSLFSMGNDAEKP